MQVLCQNENSPLERTPLNMYNKFIERVRRNLHVVLAFSPIGDAFRNRIRMFPSLINCCTIDWFKVGIVEFHTKMLDLFLACIFPACHIKVYNMLRYSGPSLQ